MFNSFLLYMGSAMVILATVGLTILAMVSTVKQAPKVLNSLIQTTATGGVSSSIKERWKKSSAGQGSNFESNRRAEQISKMPKGQARDEATAKLRDDIDSGRLRDSTSATVRRFL